MTVYLTLLGILAVTSILELLHIKLESKQKKILYIPLYLLNLF